MSTLFVVGTPIGNLSDMSYRAIQTLKDVDFIAAEDTRVTIKLLNHFDIKTPMVSYHEHNIRERGEYILSRIQNGESCAIVSDAGMPCISDPGEDLVYVCTQNGVDVKIIPGPSAAISAICLSGLKTSRFTFEGFLSTARTSRIEHLSTLKEEERTMIFYEAPHKLKKTLKDLHSYLGDRKISLARELTKIYEQVLRMTISEAISYYNKNDPRGEFVLIVEGKPKGEKPVITLDEVIEIARALVAGGVKTTDAAKQAVKDTTFRKSEVYIALMD